MRLVCRSRRNSAVITWRRVCGSRRSGGIVRAETEKSLPPGWTGRVIPLGGGTISWKLSVHCLAPKSLDWIL